MHFLNANPLKIGNLNYIINLIRDLPNLGDKVFVINRDNIDAIGYLIRWKGDKWKTIRLVNCGLTEIDIKRLLYFPTTEPFLQSLNCFKSGTFQDLKN